jgi:DNA-binding HxlR family transcriptional regulator
MLTRTLRNVERDGLVKRTVYHVVPPRVEYALTPLGETLTELLKAICTWAETHFAEIEDARVDYDHKATAGGS